MTIKIPDKWGKIPLDKAFEEPDTPDDKSQQAQPTTQIVPIQIKEPEKYLILPGNSHGKYNYDNSLISIERTLHNKDWFECHKELLKQGYHMPTIPQFVDFLNLLKSGKAFHANGKKADSKLLENIFNDITQVRDPWRAEWLDADFKYQGKGDKKIMNVNYCHELKGKDLVPKYTEQLADYLTEDRTPGIDLNEWLKNPNIQGLPKPNIKKGELYYFAPPFDNNSVARFNANSGGADLGCGGGPTSTVSGLGVRIVLGELKK